MEIYSMNNSTVFAPPPLPLPHTHTHLCPAPYQVDGKKVKVERDMIRNSRDQSIKMKIPVSYTYRNFSILHTRNLY